MTPSYRHQNLNAFGHARGAFNPILEFPEKVLQTVVRVVVEVRQLCTQLHDSHLLARVPVSGHVLKELVIAEPRAQVLK